MLGSQKFGDASYSYRCLINSVVPPVPLLSEIWGHVPPPALWRRRLWPLPPKYSPCRSASVPRTPSGKSGVDMSPSAPRCGDAPCLFRYSFSNDIPYSNSRCRRYCQPIHSKKRTLSYFFSFHSSPYLILPPPLDPDLLARLQAPTKFPRIPTRTKNISPLYHTPFPVIKHRFYLHL